jgi:hypothetical protein
MVTRSTPAIVLGPTGNLQGTYKFFSLATGKKVKRRAFTPYPMPDSVIEKVEAYAKSAALPGIFDFSNRNGILFEWNEEVDESPEGIVDVEDITLYPSLAVEHPGAFHEINEPLQSDCIAIAYAIFFTHPPLPDVLACARTSGTLSGFRITSLLCL